MKHRVSWNGIYFTGKYSLFQAFPFLCFQTNLLQMYLDCWNTCKAIMDHLQVGKRNFWKENKIIFALHNCNKLMVAFADC